MDADAALVERARKGSQDAFAELVRRHQARVFNLARALTGNDADADDLAQETFVRAFRSLDRFRGESQFQTWLYRIAVNQTRSHLRRRALLGWFSRTRDEAPDSIEQVPAAGDAEATLVQRDAIDRALAGLPPDQRVAVTLRDVEGLDYKEIAEVTGAPLGTVMSRIARGREKLKPLLASLAPRGRAGFEAGTEA